MSPFKSFNWKNTHNIKIGKGPCIKYVRPKTAILNPQPPLYSKISFGLTFHPTPPVQANSSDTSSKYDECRAGIDSISYFGLICYSFVLFCKHFWNNSIFIKSVHTLLLRPTPYLCTQKYAFDGNPQPPPTAHILYGWPLTWNNSFSSSAP